MKKFQVVGIGNAIVDVLTKADDSFLELMGIEKGIMQLVERDRAEILYGAMEGVSRRRVDQWQTHLRGSASWVCALVLSYGYMTTLWAAFTRKQWNKKARAS